MQLQTKQKPVLLKYPTYTEIDCRSTSIVVGRTDCTNIFCDSGTNRSGTELMIDGDCCVWFLSLSLSLDHFSVDKTGALICSRTDDPKIYGT